MRDAITHVRSGLTFCLAITYLSNFLIQSSSINNINLMLMIVVIALSIPVVAGTTRVISYLSFALAIILLILYHAPLSVWEQALQENMYLVVMFTVVPLLGIPIQYGGYYDALQGIFRRYVNTNSRFYLLVSFVSAFVGILVNLAVVPLVNQISQASDISCNKKLLSSAMSRGFTTCTIWAPTTAAIALIVQLTGAEWPLFFPFGILCGIIAGLIGYIMTMLEGKGTVNVEEVTTGASSTKINLRKIIELCVFSTALVSVIAIVSIKTGISTIIVVSMAALISPFIWMEIIGRFPILLRKFKSDYFNESLPKLKNEIILFVGAGLFATSITYSQLGNNVPQIISILVGHNIFLFTSVVIIGSLLFSALGIHPIIIVTIIGGTVNAAAYGMTPTYLALILAICWAMGISISPTSATVVAISGLTEQSPIRVGLFWNGSYVLISSTVIIIILTMFRFLGLL